MSDNNAIMGSAIVGQAITRDFYENQIWHRFDEITAAKLNHIEDGIGFVDSKIADKIKISTVSLTTDWDGNDPFTQVVTISGTTPNSKIDLQPTTFQLEQLIIDGVSTLVVENNNGIFKVYATNSYPTTAMDIQCTITEV